MNFIKQSFSPRRVAYTTSSRICKYIFGQSCSILTTIPGHGWVLSSCKSLYQPFGEALKLAKYCSLKWAESHLLNIKEAFCFIGCWFLLHPSQPHYTPLVLEKNLSFKSVRVFKTFSTTLYAYWIWLFETNISSGWYFYVTLCYLFLLLLLNNIGEYSKLLKLVFLFSLFF